MYLILVQGVFHSFGRWHHSFVPRLKVSCILAVIICVIVFPHADVHAWLQKQREVKLVFNTAKR